MTYIYEPGTVRWRKFTGSGDVRGYRAARGWDVEAMLLDNHPITGQPLKPNANSQWWIKETYTENPNE